MYTKFSEDSAKWEEVDDEEEGPQDRPLGNTGSDGGGVRREGLELYELDTACEVGVKPVQGGAGDA